MPEAPRTPSHGVRGLARELRSREMHADDAPQPGDLSRDDQRWRRTLVLRRTWREFIRRRTYDDAAALTFFTALGVLPAALFGVSLTALLDGKGRAADDLTAVVSAFLDDAAIARVREAIRELLRIDNLGIALLIGLVLTIWSVSGYASAFGRIVDGLYDTIEGRIWPVFRGAMIAVAVVLVVLGSGIAGILLLTPTASDDILARRGIAPPVEVVWNVGKWPVLIVLLVAFVATLFWFAPNVRFPKLRWLSLGSGLAIAIWIVLTVAFAIYVALTGAYGHFYGALGVLLVALIWAYLSNLAILIGAQLDAEILRMRELDRGIAAEESVVLELKHNERLRRIARNHDADVRDAVIVRDAARRRLEARAAREEVVDVRGTEAERADTADRAEAPAER